MYKLFIENLHLPLHIDFSQQYVYTVYIVYIQYKQVKHLNIIITNTSDKPIYEQISAQIKQAIMNSQLKEGDALPSMRFLAKELKISVITTKRAYEELEREGFITTVQGKGSFVAPQNLNLLRETQMQEIEKYLETAIDLAKQVGVSKKELLDMLVLLLEEE